VYSGTEKVDSFFELYRNGIEIDPNSLLQTLNAYRDYIDWCNDHFDVANYFFYEEHLPEIERYILNLPIFAQQTQLLTWQDNFGMRFDKWNLCHFLTSDLGTLALDQPERFAQIADQSRSFDLGNADSVLLTDYKNVRDSTWPEVSTMDEYHALPQHIHDELEQRLSIKPGINTSVTRHTELSRPLIELLPEAHQEFVNQNHEQYNQSMEAIHDMVDKGIIVSQPPIKKQTLAEKKHIVRNYSYLLDVYNQWIMQNPDLGRPLDHDTLDQFADAERARWNPATTAIVVCDRPTT
jgi:hypothetical protein